uniref:DNA-directed RNA polymerase subunit omega n=1 Tax=Schistocephalus solidus TaxID=70667 RepID=A0A183TLH5_SCHSO
LKRALNLGPLITIIRITDNRKTYKEDEYEEEEENEANDDDDDEEEEEEEEEGISGR